MDMTLTSAAALIGLGLFFVALAALIGAHLIAGALEDVAAAIRRTWPTPPDRVDAELQQRSAP